ncbi:MAG: hypothetical protein U9O66_02315, partial [Patescibacteria group bacterium]|nr:hypothetical protein [Patescibacteria group bacterium]
YKEADENYKCPDGFKAGGLRCESSLNWCEPIKELNIIGDYRYRITSMCSQNCGRYYIGSYELVDELENVEGINKREVVFATGDVIEIEELPTIAGPDSQGQINLDESEVIKFKLDNYQKIDFPKVSISEKELSNYLENKNAEFNLEFENPLNKELKFKFKIDDFERYNDFQHAVLKPKEIKSIQYIYKKDDDLKNRREKDDTLDLIIINDFVNEEYYRKYYWDEANNLDSNGTVVYIEKFVRLEDCIEPDTFDWQTYWNEEYGFEFQYPDKTKNIKINASGKAIALTDLINDESSVYRDHVLYLAIHNYDEQFNGLDEYLDKGKGWDVIQGTEELISIKKVFNQNNLMFFEVITKVNRYGRGNYFEGKAYYIEHKKAENKCIWIAGPYVYDDKFIEIVINTFKFIN